MKSTPEKTKVAARKRVRGDVSASAPRSKSSAVAPRRTTPPAKNAANLQWTFLTNHSHVLVILSQNPSLVLREVALQVGITERAVQRIIADLEVGGIIEREKVGRQNHYRIRSDQPLRHPVESHRKIGDLLALFRG